ncbi:MAG: class I SAM-dependent methyltransferase [Alphaproteobacteria bacterium]|nr:class I SAM-dependent methyltransferase [Alphaproteobacteria bacterium]
MSCRICGHSINDFLAFGDMPLANDLVADAAAAAAQDRFPLTLAFCPHCSLVQLRETVDPERLFRDYVYLSSNSASYVAHAAALAGRLVLDRDLDPASRVVEIASNDGYLLKHYARAGIPVLGIEPARNIAATARKHGIETIEEFFSASLARQLAADGLRADVIHANNVLAHVSSLTDTVDGIATLLKPNGLSVVEAPYLFDFLDRLEFDTVYHEHLCYFALTPLVRLFSDAGLEICNVERVEMHGGSLRIFVRHQQGAPLAAPVEALLEDERRWGVGDITTYRHFADRVRSFAPRFRDFLVSLRAKGYSIAAYGASAKGATLLNYCGVGTDLLDFVADLSPLKQGRAMPGVGIQVVPPSELLARSPDYVVLLAWNFAEEIIRQQSEYRRAGGRFIVPVPNPHIVADR